MKSPTRIYQPSLFPSLIISLLPLLLAILTQCPIVGGVPAHSPLAERGSSRETHEHVYRHDIGIEALHTQGRKDIDIDVDTDANIDIDTDTDNHPADKQSPRRARHLPLVSYPAYPSGRHAPDLHTRRAYVRDRVWAEEARAAGRIRGRGVLDIIDGEGDEGGQDGGDEVLSRRRDTGSSALRGLAARGEERLASFHYDAQYLVPIGVGQPPQTMLVQLDTASTITWVPDVSCDECAFANTFDHAKSLSYRRKKGGGDTFFVAYNDGSNATGWYAKESITMAGFRADEQTIGIASNISDLMASQFRGTASVGITGLAWPGAFLGGPRPVWYGSKIQWPQPLFSIYLSRSNFSHVVGNSNESSVCSNPAGGSVMFGGVDYDLVDGDVNYIPLVSDPELDDQPRASQYSLWTIPLQGVVANGRNIAIKPGATAVLDTGASLLMGPADAVRAIYDGIPGSEWDDAQGTYTFPCEADVGLSLQFGNESYSVSPADIVYSIDFDGPPLSASAPASASASGPPAGPTSPNTLLCRGAIVPSNTCTQSNTWILGDTFLKNVLSVYRYDPPSVGLARLAMSAIGDNDFDYDDTDLAYALASFVAKNATCGTGITLSRKSGAPDGRVGVGARGLGALAAVVLAVWMGMGGGLVI